MISEFKGDYAWLSNFAPVKITLLGIEYPSVEHAYMSAKSDDIDWKKFCADESNSAGKVKVKSREVKLVDNWETTKMGVMYYCLEQKFKQEPYEFRLKSTKSQNIQEGNYFGDAFWGIDLKQNPNIGENHLGRMIMRIREGLK